MKKEAGQGKRDLRYVLKPGTRNNPEHHGTVWKTTDAVRAIPECSVLYWTSTAVVKAYTIVNILTMLIRSRSNNRFAKKGFQSYFKIVLSPWKFRQRPTELSRLRQ